MADDIRAAARTLGRQGGLEGGKAKTPAKRAAAAKNLKKARAARWAKKTA